MVANRTSGLSVSSSMHPQLVSILNDCHMAGVGGMPVPITPRGIFPEELLTIIMTLTRECKKQTSVD